MASCERLSRTIYEFVFSKVQWVLVTETGRHWDCTVSLVPLHYVIFALPTLCSQILLSWLHAAKHFIVDDICCYIGSQNLYICDLAEWGVVIDNEEATLSIKQQYWDPMWKCSYVIDDCEVDKVMDGLKISREAEGQYELTKLQMEQAKQQMQYQAKIKMEKYGFGADSDEETDSEAEV